MAVEDRKRLLASITDAVSSLKAERVPSAIATAHLSDSEKQFLLADFAVMSGDFNGAIALLESRVHSSYTEQEEVKAREARIHALADRYAKNMAVVEQHLHSSAIATDDCTGEMEWVMAFFNNQLDIPRYLDTVQDLASIAPLSPEVLDLVFHAMIIASPYADVEQMGDKVLAAKGQIRIPAVASDRFFWLVIDSKQRRLYTEIDPHPFHPATINSFSMTVSVTDRTRAYVRADLVSFNLAFDQIKTISQKAGYMNSMYRLTPEKREYVLKLSPEGLVPAYALMEYVHCRLGLRAKYNGVYNLGEFVQHVTGIDARQVNLVDPKTAEPGSSGFIHGMAAIGMALGASGAAQVHQSLTQSDSASAAASQRWSQITLAGTFDFNVFDGPAFQDVEASLNVATSPDQ